MFRCKNLIHNCFLSHQQGPNQIAFDSKGTLFFTDSGALGETTLAKPRGGVFCVEGGEKDQVMDISGIICT